MGQSGIGVLPGCSGQSGSGVMAADAPGIGWHGVAASEEAKAAPTVAICASTSATIVSVTTATDRSRRPLRLLRQVRIALKIGAIPSDGKPGRLRSRRETRTKGGRHGEHL